MDFVNHGLGRGDEKPWESGTMISTATAQLTPEQSAELAHKIMALIDDAVDTHAAEASVARPRPM